MNCFPLFVAGMDTQKSGQILPKHSALHLAVQRMSQRTDR